MWCRRCCQDVPAIAAADTPDTVVCARCGDPIAAAQHANPTPAPQTATAQTSASPVTPDNSTTTAEHDDPSAAIHRLASGASLLGLDDWDLQADLDQATHLLHHLGDSTALPQEVPYRRVDAPNHLTAAAGEMPPATETRLSRPTIPSPAQLSWFVWILVCGGMMSLVFGMILCGWSLGTAREDLWRIGLPALLGGQAVLLLGFVFQLDSLWRNYRQTTETLQQIDTHLSQIKPPHMQSMMGPARRSPSEPHPLDRITL